MMEAQVTRGIAWLDEHGPENWRKKIDLSKLHMDSFRDCIIGQVFGPEMFKEIFITDSGNTDYGKAATLGFFSHHYGDLKQEWVRQLS